MIQRRAVWLLLPILLVYGNPIKAMAAEPVQASTAAGVSYIGVKECAACHSAPSPIYQYIGVTRFVRLVEATEWLKCDKHAYAYELVRKDLTPDQLKHPDRKSNKLSVEISQKLRWTKDEFEQKCLTCHVGRNASEDSAKMNTAKLDIEFGVQCESCHGPGSEYTKVEHHQQVSWRARTPDQKSELGMWDLTSPSVSAAVCLSCHLGNIQQGRFITHDMYAAGHPVLPPFDFQTFLNAMPPHWKTLQEKSIVSKSAKPKLLQSVQPGRQDLLGFELQAEYNRAHFDTAGTTDEIQHAIKGSFNKTQRSMIGGLVANDFGIELVHRAADDPKIWGDYSIYNCVGCHQELKRNNTQFRTESRTPGRAFPANWLSLDYPAIHVSNQDSHAPLTREMFASFNAVPFGDVNRLRQLSDRHLESLQERMRDRRKAERQVMTKQEVKQWLAYLLKSRQDSLADFWVAKQTAWMVCIAIDELVEHGELAQASVAPMQKELREALRLDLRLQQRQSVLDRQKDLLETARSFDAAKCKELMSQLVNTALNP